MTDNRMSKRFNLANFMVISVVVFVMFTVGFLSGGSLIYGLTSSEIDELQYQVEILHDRNENGESQNITYFYNEISLSDLYKEIKDSIVVITGVVAYQSFFGTQYAEVQGSGFIYEFNEDMVVITNNHVVSDATDIVVTFSNGNSYPSELIGADAYSDLAVLTVTAPLEEFQPLELVSSSSLKVGDPVVAIGSPMGLDGTMTTGIISQIGRTIEESLAGNFPIANIIQTSVAINPGNSGGPLLNYQGEVVGITTAIIENSEGLGFAIPSNTILRELEYLVETGSYNQHPWLGISGVDMSYFIAETMNVDRTYGWLIISVASGSAAEDAGLQGGVQQVQIIDERVIIGGDVIIGIDGVRIVNGDALMSYLEEYTQPGQTITITIVRENQILDIPITLGVRPSPS